MKLKLTSLKLPTSAQRKSIPCGCRNGLTAPRDIQSLPSQLNAESLT